MRAGGFPGAADRTPGGVVRHGPDRRWKRVTAGVAPRSWAASAGRLLGVLASGTVAPGATDGLGPPATPSAGWTDRRAGCRWAGPRSAEGPGLG